METVGMDFTQTPDGEDVRMDDNILNAENLK